MGNVDILCDKIFKESVGETRFAFEVYREIYDLNDITYKGEVSKRLYDYVKQRKYFILLLIYDNEGKVYLEKNMQDKLFWSVPGGSIYKSENIHNAIKRTSEKISKEIKIGEVEPIAYIKNKFTYDSQEYEHNGLAFIARIRNKEDINTRNFTGSFVEVTEEELESINRFANREVVRIFEKRFKKFINTQKSDFQDDEISTNENYKSRYLLHNNIIKKYILTDKRKRKNEFNMIINKAIGSAERIVDVSCGEDSFLSKLADLNLTKYVIGNDISWSQIEILSSKIKNPKVLFTNHNAVYFPFKESIFDVSYCSNTLHHMPGKDHLIGMLRKMFEVSKKIVIVEIEDPKIMGGFPYVLNKYWYMGFLGDVGGAYLSKEAFEELLNNLFENEAEINYNYFTNIQGRYMIAEIVKKHKISIKNNENKVFVKQGKFELDDKLKDEILQYIKKIGYIYKTKGKEEDLYFTDSEGEFIDNRTCLRIRKNESKDFILTYKGESEDYSNQYSKREFNVSINKEGLEKTKKILEMLNFYKYVKINKERIIYTKSTKEYEYNIYFDEIKNIGSFVEFEIISDDKQKLEDKFNEFMSQFKELNLIPACEPYRDIISRKQIGKLGDLKNINGILFDLDGTIVPSEKVFFESWQFILGRDYSVQIEKEDYIKYELENNEKLMVYLKARKEIDEKVDKKEMMDKVYEEYKDRIDVITSETEGLKNIRLIKKLKEKGLELALVTSSKKEFVKNILNKLDADDVFDVIISRDDVEKYKPDAESYLKALNKMKTSKEKCIVFEDSKRGIEAAKRAGLKCVCVLENTLATKDSFEGIEVDVFDELAEILIKIYDEHKNIKELEEC
ncbi:MAG TPA: class IV adenylate cyclase [Clostridiales bacterium]|nr:MAG: hypothetical protein A2Y22_08805 [Clostridiales bacterium GWD2_32_59]HAN10036.1 class IV adenylate cyclase [Clostridiales bacterium]